MGAASPYQPGITTVVILGQQNLPPVASIPDVPSPHPATTLTPAPWPSQRATEPEFGRSIRSRGTTSWTSLRNDGQCLWLHISLGGSRLFRGSHSYLCPWRHQGMTESGISKPDVPPVATIVELAVIWMELMCK